MSLKFRLKQEIKYDCKMNLYLNGIGVYFVSGKSDKSKRFIEIRLDDANDIRP